MVTTTCGCQQALLLSWGNEGGESWVGTVRDEEFYNLPMSGSLNREMAIARGEVEGTETAAVPTIQQALLIFRVVEVAAKEGDAYILGPY